MTEKKKQKSYGLTVTFSIKRENGVTVNVSAMCADWEMMQKFLNDFENTLQKGNDGKTA
jgi:hypothetical protein